MSKFNENYSKSIKDFMLSGSENISLFIKSQNDQLQNIVQGKNLECSSLEIFNEDDFYKSVYTTKCDQVLDSIPIVSIKNYFKDIIVDFDDQQSDYLMNIGIRVTLDERKKIIFEEWRNVISKNNKDNNILSLHKKFTEDKYEIQLGYNSCRYYLEVFLNESPKINNIKYVEYKGPITISYISSIENENEVLTNLLFENKDENNSEEVNEKMFYKINGGGGEDGNHVEIDKVETESTKKEENFDYFEKNYEIYYIDPKSNKHWGKKNYENNKNRKYMEEWTSISENNGVEEKYHKYLDDGCGKQTTEDHGKKIMNKNEVDYEYTDKYIYDVSTGDETTTKIGFDRYNKWNCYNYRNRIKNFSHVNNEASNSQDKMEWNEKWDEEGNEKSCTKWGKSEDEEWEESWKEIYDIEKDYSEKKCYKKCKKLKEDKEWYETWTEKNNGKPNCEKTCYKMNREGGNKYENYWGSIIVNYLDNKRMNYVGYINNNNKEEYVNYTYENNNN